MNWLTKAMIVLIVANSLSADEFECKGSTKDDQILMGFCLLNKYPHKDTKSGCCVAFDTHCVFNNYVRKNCELKDGFEKKIQNLKEEADKACAGIDPRKDCPSLASKTGTEKCKDVCSSAIPMNAFQPLCLIVISFVAKFLFF